MANIYPVTRRVARVLLKTIKKIGHSRGVTLRKIHEYIRNQYPYTPNNIVRLNNTLQKALAFGAVNKRNDSIIKDIVDGKGMCQAYVLRTKRLGRKTKRVRKRKKRVVTAKVKQTRPTSRKRGKSCMRKRGKSCIRKRRKSFVLSKGKSYVLKRGKSRICKRK